MQLFGLHYIPVAQSQDQSYKSALSLTTHLISALHSTQYTCRRFIHLHCLTNSSDPRTILIIASQSGLHPHLPLDHVQKKDFFMASFSMGRFFIRQQRNPACLITNTLAISRTCMRGSNQLASLHSPITK